MLNIDLGEDLGSVALGEPRWDSRGSAEGFASEGRWWFDASWRQPDGAVKQFKLLITGRDQRLMAQWNDPYWVLQSDLRSTTYGIPPNTVPEEKEWRADRRALLGEVRPHLLAAVKALRIGKS